MEYAQGTLVDGTVTSQRWERLGVSAVIWSVIPLAVGLGFVLRAEVK